MVDNHIALGVVGVQGGWYCALFVAAGLPWQPIGAELQVDWGRECQCTCHLQSA